MKIAIIAQYLGDIAHPETFNSRFLTLADMLTARQHSVEIITSDFIHSIKRHVFDVSTYKECKLTTLHEPGYAKNICMKRFFSHYILSRNLRKRLKQTEKPDVIYCAVPSLDFAFEAAKFARKHRIPLIIDIQDLWPEAFEMVAKIPVAGKMMFYPFRRRANAVYAAADEIIAVSETYARRALQVNKKCEQAGVVFLGTELSKFDRFKTTVSPIHKPAEEIWLGYAGTLGHSYDLKTVFNCLSRLKDKPFYKRLKLVVIGDGPLRRELEDYANVLALNVLFTGMLPYEQMVSVLCRCDVAVNPIKKNSAASIINKHADYAGAGLPVLNSQENVEYRNLIDEYDMGLSCTCECAKDMAEKLTVLISSREMRLRMGVRARKCAEEKFDRKNTYSLIVETIEKFNQEGKRRIGNDKRTSAGFAGALNGV